MKEKKEKENQGQLLGKIGPKDNSLHGYEARGSLLALYLESVEIRMLMVLSTAPG